MRSQLRCSEQNYKRDPQGFLFLFKIKYILKGSEKSKKKKNMPLKFILFILLLLAYTWSSELEKSEIQEIGNEKLVYGKDTIEVNVYMDKQKMRTTFHKSGNGVTIDSVVYSDGTYYIDEQRGQMTRHREESGEQTFFIYDNENHLIQIFSLGKGKARLYDDKGKLLPIYKEIRGDTIFWNLDYKDDGKFIN